MYPTSDGFSSIDPGGADTTAPDLACFIEAQNAVYEQVAFELSAGQKRSHWMWFVFPQLMGLGRSPTAIRFGIKDLDHARRYLDHPVLGVRLRECTALMLKHEGHAALDILGSPDDLKFRSRMTLFLEAAADKDDRTRFCRALEAFYNGKSDPRTLQLLRAQ